ncbi:MAG: tetratricopeptide repeat protein [Kaiparowitsia implicata GSE-PSE-MK54-09C]|jgi:tetratricopeptide (TPR) repeat protein|nr:tetratricopeptide repeat protein [Kaiparowitsia implicata GSE-PSE-MK54-09C]
MGKRKKQKATATWTLRGFGKKSLVVELQRVQAYAAKGNWQAAYEVLQVLTEQYPQEKQVWEYLADVSYELEDLTTYQKASEKILEITPNDADTLYSLGGIYITNMHPLLALQIMQRALAIAPDHEFAPKAQELLSTLTPKIPELLEEMGLDNLDVATLHERGQAYVEEGDYTAAREAELEVIQRYPEFVSAHNHLALVNWAEGRVEDAIATSQSVLSDHPDNVHALSNLIRFLVISGDSDAAQVYGERLKTTQAEAWDNWTKRVEGLSYLADDASIVEVLNQAEADGVEDSPAGALFFHLTAVALARTGDETRALKQWKTALQRSPGMTLAQENLSDVRRPVGQRHGAWPLSWEQWLLFTTARDVLNTVKAVINKSHHEKTGAAMEQLLDRHPDLLAMLPRIMERGGPLGQRFGLIIAQHVKTPELLAVIKDFALGQHGTDEMRHQAASIAAEAGLIPRDKVTLWVKGKPCEIMLLAYEIYAEPSSEHTKAVDKLLNQATQKLYQHDKAAAVEAEALLQQALEIEPDAPDLLNNLAMAYILQDRQAEADAIVDDLVERFPDYLFARCAKARTHLDAGDIEAADALLKPMLSRDRFHTSEFETFADVHLRLLVEKDQLDGARSWLQMWEQVGLDSAALAYWQGKLLSKSVPRK